MKLFLLICSIAFGVCAAFLFVYGISHDPTVGLIAPFSFLSLQGCFFFLAYNYK